MEYVEGRSTKVSASTERTERLKRKALAIRPEVSVERGRLITESFKEKEGEPLILRRANAFKKILEEMTIYINEGELIVGNEGEKPRSGPVFPETTAIWLEEELDGLPTRPQDPFEVSSSVKNELKEEILPYWKDKTVHKLTLAMMPEETKRLLLSENAVFSPSNMYTNTVGHFVADYEKVLEKGWTGIREEICEKLEDTNEATSLDHMEKRLFYAAGRIVCESATSHQKRYAELAQEIAGAEKDKVRKEELLKIAENCCWIAKNPPRSFYEALQAVFFVHEFLHIENDAQALSIGRLDQYLYRFYQKDIEAGVITRARALELLECFWIKLFENNKIFNDECAHFFAGYSITQNLIVGGITEDLKDAVNEVSYLCLDAESNLRLSQPAFSVRVHEKTPQEFWMRAVEVVRGGGGKPPFYNDEAQISSLLLAGVAIEDARDYSIEGCVEPVGTGNTYGWSNAALFNLGKILELTLNRGIDPLTGQQVGPESADPQEMATFEEFLVAYEKQMRFFVRHMAIALNHIDLAHREVLPNPFLSVVLKDCVETGKDVSAGGARYNFMGVQGIGIADVADALANIKGLVFDQKKITMKALLKALKDNFEGDSKRVQTFLLKEIPKYGNDESYVDSLAHHVAKAYTDEVRRYRNIRGGSYRPGLYPVSANVPLGSAIGALPSGRKAFQPLADGISPSQGKDKKGPTAVFNSVATIDQIKATNGTLLNQKFHPSALNSEKDLAKFINLIKAYFSQGGMHVQFNVVSAETLLAAQHNPDEYRDLLVRVAGYCAFFVELAKETQDDIISRTEFDSPC